MNHLELRQKFISFFESKGHILVSSSSLLPINDNSVLLTTAGMQQFKPYFVGSEDAQAKLGSLNAVSIQKCFRTADIDETGDDTHLTFFEMMGHFSFGGYFKPEALAYAWEFLTDPDYLGIDKSRIYATYYNGDRAGAVADMDAKFILESLPGLLKIVSQGATDNFWGPTGEEGPCGPTVEFYVDGVEIWNEVFNEFYCNPDKTLTPLAVKGVDMGGGLERILAAVNHLDNVFATDLFDSTRSFLSVLPAHSQRIVADHIRGTVFLLADHVLPSNKEQGYILRRILRRLLIHIHSSGISLDALINATIDYYQSVYPELANQREDILAAARVEADKFSRTLDAGTRELTKLINSGANHLDGETAFKLFSTFGLPIDYMKEKVTVDVVGFEAAFKAHQDMSRGGAEQKFGGHGLSAGAQVSDEARAKITALHTATHLLHAALHHILGAGVEQAGSDITPERTRFDFTFPRKLTDEEQRAVEDWVNQKIQAGFQVKTESMPYEAAIASGAHAFFKEKYPAVVEVYTVYNKDTDEVISRELCGGPHVTDSSELGHFTILKEESSSAGIRRVKATLQ